MQLCAPARHRAAKPQSHPKRRPPPCPDRSEQRVAAAEAELRRLRERQRALNEAAGRGHAQAAGLSDLARVLEAKIAAAGPNGGRPTDERRGAGAAAGFHTATANVAVF
jgi:hypothetical protein